MQHSLNLSNVLESIALAFGYLTLGLLPACGVLYAIYFLLTLPMRRKERARLFLDILEMGLNAGHSPELAIQSPASSRDQSLGVRFHLLAAHLEQGVNLAQALDKVPNLLPPQVVATLKTGERIGDLRKILPACRHLLRDGVSHVRGALNYLVLLAFVVTPFTIFIPLMLRIKVIPSFEQIFSGLYENSNLPAFTQMVFAENYIFTWIQLAVLFVLWTALFFYLAGPRARSWLTSLLPNYEFLSPWRSKRLQRDFSAMLAVLLDAGVPESESVRLAAESTASPAMRRRAKHLCVQLTQGVTLPDALGSLDKSGEFRWRLTNALRRGKGFLQALAGWHEALDARAFQLEQTAAQVTTSSLVLLNGLIVAAICIAVFLALVNFINQAALW